MNKQFDLDHIYAVLNVMIQMIGNFQNRFYESIYNNVVL